MNATLCSSPRALLRCLTLFLLLSLARATVWAWRDLSSARGDLLSSSGGAERHKVSTASDAAIIPWLASGSASFGYAGLHNQLDGLLGVQANDRRITVFAFNRAVTRFALNCIYSFIKFGQGDNYIVAATDAASLQVCIQHRLPCYNASHVLPDSGTVLPSSSIMAFGSSQYMSMVWGKVRLVQQVLRLGYTVHFSDVDVVYMRPVWASYDKLMHRLHADAVFMHETDEAGAFNTGVYTMTSNRRTLALMDRWLSQVSGLHNDQDSLIAGAGQAFNMCHSARSCLQAQASGLAALYRHPMQLVLDHCPLRSALGELLYSTFPCSPSRLFLHVICTDGWGMHMRRGKGRLLERYKLWLLDSEGRPGRYREDEPDKRHPFLPCPGLAWEQALRF